MSILTRAGANSFRQFAGGGQKGIRAALLAAYSNRRAIIVFDVVEALEAAHIESHRGAESNHPQNGRLLRADLHSLFELGLLAIDNVTMTVQLAPAPRGTVYGKLHGRKLRRPGDTAEHPLGAVAGEPLGLQPEAFLGPVDHGKRALLCLTQRKRLG